MRAKNMILFVIAIGCGLVASIGVSQYMDQGAAGPAVDTVKIYVAVSDINIGDRLDAQHVALEEWPRDRMPEGAITDLSKVESRYPRTRLFAGEPIIERKLMDSPDRGSKAVMIPEGYRVVSVRVTVDTAVAGLIQPGDRVDLVLFVRKNQEVLQTGTRTILRDVNVFSVDGDTERSVDEEGQARNLRTVSLLVTPKQAETVMLANELGTLSLTLRRPNDTYEYISNGETVDSLLGTRSESANENGRRGGGPVYPPGWPGTLPTATAARPPSGDDSSSAGPNGPAWTMKILSSNGYREYQWQDGQALPQEVTPEKSPQPAKLAAPNPTRETVLPQDLLPGGTPEVTEPEPAPTETVTPTETELRPAAETATTTPSTF